MKKEIIENQKNHIKISGSDNFLLSLYEKDELQCSKAVNIKK